MILDFETDRLEDPESVRVMVPFDERIGSPKVGGEILWDSKVWAIAAYDIVGHGPMRPINGQLYVVPVKKCSCKTAVS